MTPLIKLRLTILLKPLHTLSLSLQVCNGSHAKPEYFRGSSGIVAEGNILYETTTKTKQKRDHVSGVVSISGNLISKKCKCLREGGHEEAFSYLCDECNNERAHMMRKVRTVQAAEEKERIRKDEEHRRLLQEVETLKAALDENGADEDDLDDRPSEDGSTLAHIFDKLYKETAASDEFKALAHNERSENKVMHHLILDILKNTEGRLKGENAKQRRYHCLTISWCLNLRMKIKSKAYEEIRHLLSLPCDKTLKSKSAPFSLLPSGVNSNIVREIRKRVDIECPGMIFYLLQYLFHYCADAFVLLS